MSVYKSKDGRWYYRCYYSDLLGNRKQKNSKMYDTKKECIQAEVQFKLDTSKTSAQSITMEQLMLNYIEESSRGNTKKTKNDKLHRMKYCKSILNMKIDKITPSIMQRFKNEVDALSLGTARKNQILALCNSSFNYAIKFYGLQSNPMTFVDKIKETSEEKMREMNIYTPSQFNTFLSQFSSSHREYRNLCYVLYWTGMRRNEARSITFNDYDDKYIYVSKQFDGYEWSTLKTKGSKRKIAIDEDIYNVLQEQYNKYKAYEPFNKSWFVFGGYRQLPRTTLENVKNQAIKDAGLPYIRIHDLRHSHASYLIEKGVNMYKISKRLGHSSISITMDRYGHLLDDGDEILNALKDK